MIMNSNYCQKIQNSKQGFDSKFKILKTLLNAHTLGSVTTEDINVVKYSELSKCLVWVGGSVSEGVWVFAVYGGHAIVCVLSCWGEEKISSREIQRSDCNT